MIAAGEIIEATAEASRLSAVDLRGRSQRRSITVPRRRAMYVCRLIRPDVSYHRLGQLFGRDRRLIMRCVAHVAEQLVAGDDAELAAIETIVRRLNPLAALDRDIERLSHELADTEAKAEAVRAELMSAVAERRRMVAGNPFIGRKGTCS